MKIMLPLYVILPSTGAILPVLAPLVIQSEDLTKRIQPHHVYMPPEAIPG